MNIIISSLIAIIAVVFAIKLLRPLAFRIGLVDRPGGRKQHLDDIPLIGGIALFFAFCFALLTLPGSLDDHRGLIASAGLLVLIGVTDDFHDISSVVRLCGQVLAALLLVIWGDAILDGLGNLFFIGNFSLGLWGIPFTVFAVILLINAMNMIDGQDGLAGGVALGQAVMLMLVSVFFRTVR